MPKTPRSLAGKMVAITGGGRGIGRATAAALIVEGAHVALGDVDAALAARTAEELGAGTIALPLDVTDRDSFEAFLTEAEQRLGPLDVLVNNAGIMPIGPLLDESDETTDARGGCDGLFGARHQGFGRARDAVTREQCLGFGFGEHRTGGGEGAADCVAHS